MTRFDTYVERDIAAAARSEVNVLITGADACTRRLVAERIHQRGANGPLVVVTCSDSWDVESDATVAALGATVFLEDVGELTDRQQAGMMELLDRQVLRRAPHAPVWRVISASDADLYTRVTRGTFRADLFHRLNLIHIVISGERL